MMRAVIQRAGELPVSVVIVNYQSYGELRACLESLQRAPDTPHVVVVDHESNAAAAAAVRTDFPDVRLLPVAGNDGFAAGVNRGARESRASFLILLNPDCIVEPSTCATLVDWMRAHPAVGAAGPRIHNADGTVQATARRFPDFTTAIAGRSSWLTRVLPKNPLSERNLPGRDAAAEPFPVDWVSGACLITRREAFDAIGGFDEGFFLYWEDADFCRRLWAAGWQTVYLPSAAITHLGGCSSRHSADSSLDAFHRSAFRLYWKHASTPARLLAPLVYAALRLRLAIMKRVIRRRVRPLPARPAAIERHD
jgi:GT2 family glycosyltransferase